MERLGDMLKRELGRFGAQAGIGEVVDAWPAAVGEEIARNAWPARFTRDGTLVVHTRDSVWGFELTQRADEIAKRLSNVKSVKFMPGPLPEAAVDVTRAAPQGPPPPTPEQIEQAAEWTSVIDDEHLREVVAKTAELSLSRAANDRSF